MSVGLNADHESECDEEEEQAGWVGHFGGTGWEGEGREERARKGRRVGRAPGASEC